MSRPPEPAWSTQALATLSRRIDVERWRKSRWLNSAKARTSGVVRAVGSPEERPMLIFLLELQGSGWVRTHWTGLARVRAGARVFEFTIDGAAMDITVDGRPMGKIDTDGTIRDRNGTPIGAAVRPLGAPYAFRITVGPFSREWHKDPRAIDYAVDLGGRTIARLYVARYPTLGLARKASDIPAIELIGRSSAKERRWILAAAIREMVILGPIEGITEAADFD